MLQQNVQQDTLNIEQLRQLSLLTPRSCKYKLALKKQSTDSVVTRTIAALLISMSIAHAAEPDTCHVAFAALNNNQPLLAQSATTIRNAEKIVFDSKNHSFTTTLPCGQTYVVTVTSGITTRTSEFRALPYNNIRVEMGDTK